jgi:MEMO1 family protein
MTNLPKLRLVDVRPFTYEGRPSLLLRDPLRLSEQVVVLPQLLAPLLALCDGTRDAAALGAAAAVRYGLPVSASTVERVLQALDDAVLLENDHFVQERERVRQVYRAAPFRQPSLAGSSYPADPDELRSLLDSYLDGVDGNGNAKAGRAGDRGLVSPHIDYERGGPVYAQVWQQAAEAVRAADLAIIFGTDHFGGDPLNLTQQSYATPFGVLPTARDIVDEMAEAIGAEAAYRGELRHRGEHSVELAAVWLHHMRGGRAIEMVPILCGSFARYLEDGFGPEDDRALNEVVEILRRRLEGRRAVVVAAGDLAHVGPAFGGQPIRTEGRARLKTADDELIDRMSAGDAGGFLAAIKRVQDSNNVCGISPIYLTLRLLDPAQGEPAGYDMCPADGDGTSVVSVCGVVFH